MKGNQGLLIAGAIVIAGLAIGAGLVLSKDSAERSAEAAPTPEASPISIEGSVSVILGEATGFDCTFEVGDTPPVNVTFKDDTGRILGTTTSSRLKQSKASKSEQASAVTGQWMGGTVREYTCEAVGRYDIEIPEAAFYEIEVAGASAGSASLSEIEASGYKLDI